jgi:hypothetical protein
LSVRTAGLGKPDDHNADQNHGGEKEQHPAHGLQGGRSMGSHG